MAMRIGIDLGGTKVEAIALDGDGRELARRRIATRASDYAATIEAIVQLVAEIERGQGRRGTVGIGIPGVVAPATGLVKNANSVWLIGRPLTGANAIAGEWGHNPLPWPRDDERTGRPCYCGRAGCLETFLSGPGLSGDHATATGERLDPPEIVRRAEAGGAAAEATLRRYEDRLARGLASVINLLDPDVIVLGGGLSNIRRLYERVPRLWGAYVFSDRVDTRLVPPRHGDSSGVRGAAWLWPPEGENL